MGLPGLELGCGQGFVSGALGENLFSCPFQDLEAACAPRLRLQSQQWLGESFSLCLTLNCLFCHSLPHLRTHGYIGRTKVIQNSVLVVILNFI